MAIKIKPTAVGILGILFTLGFAALPISQWEVGGLTLTLLYVWRRNLWVNIIAHFIVDAAVLGG
jgi:membrane protease YdiL (CAAX protease family)